MPTWLGVALYAFAGGVAAALAALVARRYRRRGHLAAVVAVALSLGLVRTFLAPWVADVYRDATARTPLQRFALHFERAARRDPALSRWAREATQAEGSEYAARGLKRLPAERLVRRAALVNRMLGAAPDRACEAFASGRPSAADLDRLLAPLSDAEIRAYAELGSAAAAAELAGSPVLHEKPGEAEVEGSLRAADGDAAPAELEKVRAAVRGEATLRDTCRAMRLLYRRAAAAEGAAGARLAVFLAWH